MKLVPGPQKLELEGESSRTGGDERPPWHRLLVGVVSTFGAWLPLVFVARWVVAALMPRGVDARDREQLAQLMAESDPWRTMALLLGPPLVAFALACAVGGAVVGRTDDRRVAKLASLSGTGAALIAWVLGVVAAGALSVGALGWLVGLVAIASMAAGLGGIAGAKWKR